MNKSDFKFKELKQEDEHEDYWFTVSGNSQKELENEYKEMCMVGIESVVYSKDEDLVGIKRIFHFNWDVIISEDNNLKSILIELSSEINN